MITMIKPGLLTTIQDNGRLGFQRYGIPSSGVMDVIAHRIANLLVGNDENQATLEMTLIGPSIYFEKDTLISICGADLSPAINNIPVPLWRPLVIKKGCKLDFSVSKKGCRCYLAAAGGFDVPEVMNSRSTYLRAGIGGFQGRMLKSDDQLNFQRPGHLSLKIFRELKNMITNKPFQSANWFAVPWQSTSSKNIQHLRVVGGSELSLFTHENRKRFLNEKFIVTSKSDRMGYRLKGGPLLLEKAVEMISEAVNFGTIQVPPDGNPIILMADRQTIGGYPKIGQVAAVDLPFIAQAKPGDFLTFKIISLAEAQLLYLQREKSMRLIKQGIIQQFC